MEAEILDAGGPAHREGMEAEILDAGGPAYREGMDAEIPMSRRPNAVRESRQSGLAVVVSSASEKDTPPTAAAAVTPVSRSARPSRSSASPAVNNRLPIPVSRSAPPLLDQFSRFSSRRQDACGI